MASAFDTLTAARELEAAGMDRQQAEAVAGAIRSGQGELATKADLEALRTDLDALQQATKADLTAAISSLEARLTWRMVIIAGVIVAAIKLIPAP